VDCQKFCHKHRVVYGDCTVGNHIYYARYLDLLEAARGEFFRSLQEPFLKWQELDTIFPVIECQLRYRHPARYDDVLSIETWFSELERVRMKFSYQVLNQNGAEILLASTSHACTSTGEKLKRIPEELVAKLRPFHAESNPAET